MSEAGKVLAVFAHPDDETYGPGATLARLSAEGSRVRLVTFTRGESATMGDSVLFSPAALAKVREKELDCACRALGIAGHELLAFPDGRLAELAESELAAPIAKALGDFAPSLVMTFHPEGISGHGDHKAVSKAVKSAIASWTGTAEGDLRRSPALAYYVVPESVAAKIGWRRLHAPPDREVTHAVETGPYLRAKIEAVQCHRTQRYMFERLNECEGGIKEIWSRECFIVEGERRGGRPRPALPVIGAHDPGGA